MPSDPPNNDADPRRTPLPDWLAGGGEMGDLVRSVDWSNTALGPVSAWPQSLRTTVSTCLNSKFPILIWWGRDLVKIYNDAYRPILGDKHPRSMGQRGAECWPEIWHIIGPMLEGVMNTGQATWSENQMLPLVRHGFAEECYFTFSYSPIRDESGGIGGVFCAVTETTAQILGERRLRTLRAIPQRTAHATTAEEACARAAEALGENRADVPFALIYLVDETTRRAHLAGSTGDGGSDDWPLDAVLASGNPMIVEGGPSPHKALLLPIGLTGEARSSGVLVVGLSDRLRLDDQYRSFLDLVAGHIATAITGVRTLEAAEQRARALAEIDRAKTQFFSNISHEFRTPLTLMLGPTEDALSSPERALHGEDLEVVHRNELRLLELVNTLLEFSCIEAGRAEASFEPVELSVLTTDLAAGFRSAIERAGLRLEVHCDPLGSEVHVDRDMWERIVLNLLSNAFKFTFEGTISVELHARDGRVELVVRDTGVGIPKAELPRVFERFHRIEGTRSRTHEGTGIGLALVRDLVNLHEGEISVSSEEGRGTTFTVSVPMAQRMRDRSDAPARSPQTARRVETFVGEATRWAREDTTATPELGRLRRAAENERRTLYALFEQAPAAIAVVRGKELVFELTNPRYEELVDRGRLIGRSVWEVFPELEGQPLGDVLGRVYSTGERFVGREFQVQLRRSGVMTDVYFDFVYEPLRLEDGTVDGIMLVALEVTDRVRGARERERLIAEREGLEAERHDLLNREREARREAERALRAKDEFLAMLGHELRNPLAPIATALQVLKLRGDSGAHRERTVIERQVAHLTELVDDLLDVSRITRGKIELRRGRIEIAAIVARAIEIASPLLEQRRHELVVDVPRTGLVVDADATRLAQVISNLLTNAAKYSEPGQRIVVAADEKDGVVEVRVVNREIGIAADMLPHVFELFVQESQAIDRAQGGLGLGLAIVRSLVEMHGGTVSASSAGRGAGSTFTVRLPLAADAARASPAPAAEPVHSHVERGCRVLIVDDNADAAEMLALVMTELGCEARVAHDGPSALVVAESFPADLALLDIGLPVMDGFELAKHLRALQHTANTYLVAVTGYGQSSDMQRSRNAGFNEHLVKPVGFDELEGVLARFSASHQPLVASDAASE